MDDVGMSADEIKARQVIQDYVRDHPSATRVEIECHARRKFGWLGRADWWRVNEAINKVIQEVRR